MQVIDGVVIGMKGISRCGVRETVKMNGNNGWKIEYEAEKKREDNSIGGDRTQQRFLEFFDAYCMYSSSLLLFFFCYTGCKQYIDILGGKSPETGHWYEINVTETNSYMDYQ
jgi:hypothetical protein